jgi:hypothetical protein
MAGKKAGRMARMPGLWPDRPFRRSISTNSTKKVIA